MPWGDHVTRHREVSEFQAYARARGGVTLARPTVFSGGAQIIAVDDPALFAWIREVEPAVNYAGTNSPLRSWVDRTGPSIYTEYESQLIKFPSPIPASHIVALSFRSGIANNVLTGFGGGGHFLYVRYLSSDFDPATVTWNDRAAFSVYLTDTAQFAVSGGDLGPQYTLDCIPHNDADAGIGYVGRATNASGVLTAIYGVEIFLSPFCSDDDTNECTMDFNFEDVTIYRGEL